MIEQVICTYPPTCPYVSQGAVKPDPPQVYILTAVKAQNVRAAPHLNALAVDSIPRNAKNGEAIRYGIYWEFGDWLALDNKGTRWVAKWLGKVEPYEWYKEKYEHL